MKSNKTRIQIRDFLVDGRLTVLDWVLFALIAGVCYFTFQHGDILHTGGSSFAYLNGHILDFYDYNVPYLSGNSYLPSTYILFAIWNIPLKLLGLVNLPTVNVGFGVLMWFKALPVLFYLATGGVVYKITKQIGMGSTKAKYCMYAFLTMPIAVFSQFCFGQYDIFTVFFMMLGIYYYFKEDNFKFILFFGISITFKYQALLIFWVLLLLKEKNILQVIKKTILMFLPLLFEVLIYVQSPAFRTGVFGFGGSKLGYMEYLSVVIYSQKLLIVYLIMCMLLAYAYFTEVKNKISWVQYSFFFCNLCLFCFFGLSMWHPQWLLIAVPFWVISTFINKRFDFFVILEILMMLVYITFTVQIFTSNVDQALFIKGAFGSLVPNISDQLTMGQIFKPLNASISYTIFSAAILVQAVFKHPRYCVEDFSEPIEKYWPLVRLRFVVGMMLFIIPAFICFAVALTGPVKTFTAMSPTSVIGAVVSDHSYAQTFVAKTDTIEQVNVMIGTYTRQNHSKLTLQVMDGDKMLSSKEINVPKLVDNGIEKIKFAPVAVQKGKEYRLEFKATDTKENDCVTIYRTADASAAPVGDALIDGTVCPFDLCVEIFGK